MSPRLLPSILAVAVTLFLLATVVVFTTPVHAQEQADTGRVVDGRLVTDTFAIDHEWQGDTLVVSIRSDLPDAATVMVSVDRRYWRHGSSLDYSRTYLSEKSLIGVWEGRPHRVVIDNEAWKKDLENHQREMARVGEGFRVRRIEDSVRVEFVVPINQYDPRFGDENNNLVGEAVRTEGLRVVEEELALPHPLEGRPASTTRWASPRDLSAGNTYMLGGEAPLMPAFEPDDPLRAAAQARFLPAGTEITIQEVRYKSGTPWYRVRAERSAGGVLGTGWINSTALLGQDLRVSDGGS